MTVKTQLEVRRSEVRTKLAELAASEEDDARDEIRQLSTEYQDLEARLSAIAISEDVDEEGVAEERDEEIDAEGDEINTILGKVRLSRYVERAAKGGSLDGAEAELNDALEVGSNGDVTIPMALLSEPEQIEDRADAVTELNINTVQRPERWLPRVFIGTGSEFLGVKRQSVNGIAAFPVIRTGSSGETVAKGASKDAEAATITVETMDPKRISSRYLYAREDMARLGPETYESALRSDLRESMAEAMDKDIITGGTGINGLSGDLEADPDASLADPTTGAGLVKTLFGLIEGRYAKSPSDIKAIMRPNFYTYMLTLPLGIGETDAMFVDSFLRGGHNLQTMSNAHIPGVTGDTGESYLYASLARGKEGAAVHAVWSGVELIRDIYTDASEGRIAITAIAMHNFKVIRDANFRKIRVSSS